MLGYRHLVVFILCLTVAGGAAALVAPRDGGALPEPIQQLYSKDGRGYVMTGGWSQKVKTLKERREAFLAANGPQALSSMPAEFAVAGTMEIPVLLVEFANRPGPFDSVAVQTKLFGPQPGTVTDYYDEVSYGQFVMTGTVYDWAPLAHDDAFYEGLPPDCNGLCTSGNMYQMLKETLDLKDPAVDFARYDNDGPDGVPNSGDDDGFVDFVSFIHSEYGGECGGNNNIWSHQYVYERWAPNDSAYTTTDAAFNGGFIMVNEYTMQPVRSCPPDDATINEIGVFCHEFGHAFGLPDLYDVNGQGSGIGHWGIMGSGNWNQPASPAHPCAWTRWQLGWITPTDITWQENVESIDAIATSGEALLLGFTYNRFRRSNECRINGAFSMYCGLEQGEGVARGWSSDAIDRGYGNTWNETIEREFEFDGTTPVNMAYEYRYDTEAGYDSCFTVVEVNGVENVLDEFSGQGVGTASHDITAYVSGLPPGGKYTIKFRGVSDLSYADEDGNFNSNCGMFVVDDVAVNGGGENHLADFEGTDDGWFQSASANPPREYWLIENRQVFGFDAFLHGTGLLVTHVDETIIEAPFLGNSGGSSQGRVKGVVLEEADTFRQLEKGLNRGDAGDVYPGSSNNRAFNVGSGANPTTLNNSWGETLISITNISDSGDPMTATIRAGDPGPVVTNSVPGLVDNDVVETSVTITGHDIAPGATFLFTLAGGTLVSGPALAPADGQDIPGTSIRWTDPTLMGGTINVYSKTGGDWDLIVTNPDGQAYTYPSALTINPIVAAQLQSAVIQVAGQAIRLEYRLFDTEADESIRLSRSRDDESAYVVIERNLQADDGLYVYLDGDVEPGTKYYYKLDVVSSGGDVRELHRGSAAVPAGEMKLAQNFPNPFNPVTSISFYLPKRLNVRLEVFDIAGRLVTRLGGGIYQAGPHKIEWNGVDANGSPVSSGVYVYRLSAGNRAISKKMILLK